jgi:D-3-phosphoglycerate dehydrogenase / 2-oxoglutarate reductase
MIGETQIALMRPTTILINVSRGGLIDEVALARALAEGHLFGAGLDVFEQEPLTTNSPILSAPNTVLSDHTAWYSERSVHALQNQAAQEVARVLSGKHPKNWVNRW